MPYRILYNGELWKSLEARTGAVLTYSHFTPLHKIRGMVPLFGVAPLHLWFDHLSLCGVIRIGTKLDFVHFEADRLVSQSIDDGEMVCPLLCISTARML